MLSFCSTALSPKLFKVGAWPHITRLASHFVPYVREVRQCPKAGIRYSFRFRPKTEMDLVAAYIEEHKNDDDVKELLQKVRDV